MRIRDLAYEMAADLAGRTVLTVDALRARWLFFQEMDQEVAYTQSTSGRALATCLLYTSDAADDM
eukprot:1802064-Prymnesium_polylepis.1